MTTLLLAGLVPFLVALGASGLLGRYGGATSLPLALGLLAGFVALTRAVPFLGHPAQALVGQAALVAVPLAAILGRWPPGPRLAGFLAVGLGAAAAGLPAGLAHPAALDSAGLVGALVAALLGAALVRRAETLRAEGQALPVLGLLAVALAAIAAVDHAGLASSLALALAAAALGVLAWTPLGRVQPDSGIALVGLALLMLLAVTLWESAPATPWGILVLTLGLWPEVIANRLPGKRGRRRRGRAGSRILLGTAIPAIAAVLVALVIERGFGTG